MHRFTRQPSGLHRRILQVSPKESIYPAAPGYRIGSIRLCDATTGPLVLRGREPLTGPRTAYGHRLPLTLHDALQEQPRSHSLVQASTERGVMMNHTLLKAELIASLVVAVTAATVGVQPDSPRSRVKNSDMVFDCGIGFPPSLSVCG